MKLFRIFWAALAATALLASCENNLPEVADPGETDPSVISDTTGNPADSVTIHFSALADPATRTAFGAKDGTSYPTLWTANDSYVHIAFRALSGATLKNQDKQASVTPGPGNTSAEFTVDMNKLSEVTELDSLYFYSLSPESAHASFLSGEASSRFTILDGQTPSAGSPDERAQILAAKAEKFTAIPSSVSFSFRHVTAYGKFSIINLDYGTETIESISLTAEDNWVGSYKYNYDSHVLTEFSASKGLTLATSSLENIWFACAPVDLGGKTIDVTVNTDAHAYTKTITIPAGKKFTAGKVAAFTVDMAGILPDGFKVYNKVTDVTDLTAGSEVIIVAADADFAMSSAQASNNRGQAAITKSGDDINSPSASVAVFTLEAGEVDNTLAFKDSDDNYLYAAGSGSSKNYLRSQATNNADGSWSVSITSGVATVKAQGTNTNNWMRYNSLFACYASGQNDICIYKLAGSGTSTVLVREVCATPSVSCTSNTVTITCATEGASIYYTTDGSEPTASSTLYSDPFAIASSCTVKAIAVKAKYRDSSIGSADCAYRLFALYTNTTKTEVSASGTTPAGSAATYSQTSNNTFQITADKSAILTLSGYSGKTIKAITLSMKSNSS
ncbi:MAG: chitobiase/beta-hexosaminidase C-terminal domain-containing protein, partial [Bacteroidales bacterium]|nr:chitobiase/beta-hexosaminidase C-terminal domain-containing protein [Bacteroidales bacterium]